MGKRTGAYHRIATYGVIGDGRRAALVGSDGSIDWLCWPRFDSPSVFGALLDSNRGGRFAITPTLPYQSRQRYLPNTNVLVTQFETADGVLELTDFLHSDARESSGCHSAMDLVRVARCVRGEVPCSVVFDPRPDYARMGPNLRPLGGAVAFDTSQGPLFYANDLGPATEPANSTYTLQAGQSAAFRLSASAPNGRIDWAASLHKTKDFWERWAAQCTYQGAWRTMVVRSALALKLLIYWPTGAVVAAPTTSLPERIGGVRNWDYRYTWLRDAGMTLNALFSLGYRTESSAYADWVIRALHGCEHGVDGIMYDVTGGCSLPEEELDHLEGYRGSRPVRFGNAAHVQRQLDVYGQVFDCFVVCRAFETEREPAAWQSLRRLADRVVEEWRKPDAGIWEVRSTPRHFVHSKVLAWVALDRAIHAAKAFNLPAGLVRWQAERALIKSNILRRGLAGNRPFLARAYDDPGSDAANLLAVTCGILPIDHPVLAATVDSVLRELGRDALVFRYLGEDGLPGEEGAFLPCSFWLVEALAKLGRVDEASELFEEALSYANPLGLFPEEMDPDTKEYLGNYPQALTHIALINAALALEHVQGD